MSATEPEVPGPGRGAEIGLRVAGTVAGLLLGFLTALWEIFLSPLRAGGFPLPVSPVAAIATNLALVWFTRRVTGRTGLALLPGVVWFGTMIIAANKTTAGDLLIPGNDYMGLAAVLLGCVAWGVGGYWMVLAARPAGLPRPAGPAAVAPARPPAPGPKPGAKPAGAKPVGAKPAGAGRPPGRRRPSGR